jgi:hypothetical protein
MRIDLVQGDLVPIAQVLTGASSLVGATAKFVMSQVHGTKRVEADAIIDDPVKLIVRYQPAQGDTDTPGIYRAQWQIAFAGAIPETWPSDEPLYVVIHPKL